MKGYLQIKNKNRVITTIKIKEKWKQQLKEKK